MSIKFHYFRIEFTPCIQVDNVEWEKKRREKDRCVYLYKKNEEGKA